MTEKRISLYTHLVVWAVAAVLPAAVFGQTATTSRPAPGANQPVTHRPAAPSIEQLNQILRRRGVKNPAATRPAVTTPPSKSAVPGDGAPEAEAPAGKLPTTLPAGVRGIQFSFNNAPYSAVFDFIERISGLPIVGDRNVQGTLTYFNRKLMTVDEAMEQLNLLLRQKNVVLVRVDDRLELSKFPDALRLNPLDFVGADSFFKSGVPSNRVVRVIFQIENLSADELNNILIEAVPVGELKAAAWRTTNQIQVVALASQARDYIRLAQRLDRELAHARPGQNVRVFKPKYITAGILANLLRQVAPQGGVFGNTGPLGAPDGPGGARPPVRPMGEGGMQIAQDDSSGTVIVRATPPQMEEIVRIIEMLDKPQTDEGNSKAVRVAMEHGTGSVQSIVVILNDLKQRASKGGTQANLSIQGDDVSRSIILAGDRNLVDRAEAMVKALDKPMEKGTKIQVIGLKAARADEILNQVLNPWYRGSRREPPVAADLASNSIITWATGSDFEDLKSVIQELDRSAEQGTGLPTIKVVRFDDGDVNAIANSLRSAFPNVRNVSFGADPTSRTVIISAPRDKYTLIDKAIEDIRKSVPDRVVRQIVQVKFANVDQVANAIQRAYQPTTPGAPRLDAVPNMQAGSILLSGPRTVVDDAAKLVTQLDDRIRATSEIKSFKLSYAQSDDLAAMIRDLYTTKDPTVKVVSDPWSNTLFISGGAGSMGAIEQMIKTADKVDEPAEDIEKVGNFEIIPLKTASAVDAADQIASRLIGTGKNAPTVEAADNGNYLMVTGQPKQIERVRQMAEQIDKMALQIPEILVVRPIQKVAADKLARMLNAIVPQLTNTRVKIIDVNLADVEGGVNSLMVSYEGAGRKTGTESVVMIGVDKKSNTLVFKGRPKDIDEIDKAIATLTADVDNEVQFKIFTLKFANPSDVAAQIEALFNDPVAPQPVAQQQGQQGRQRRGAPGQPGQPGAAPNPQPPQANAPRPPTGGRRVRAIPVDTTSSVVVRADPRDFQMVEEFIAQLDLDIGSTIKIFPLKSARADNVVKTLNELFSGQGRRGSGRFRMMAGQGGMMNTAAMMGQTDQTIITADAASNSIIVSAGKARIREIEQLIKTLDDPNTGPRRIYVIPMKNIEPNEVKQIFDRLIPGGGRSAISPKELSSPGLPGLPGKIAGICAALALGQTTRQAAAPGQAPATAPAAPRLDETTRMRVLRDILQQARKNAANQPTPPTPTAIPLVPRRDDTTGRSPQTIVEKSFPLATAPLSPEATRQLQALANKLTGNVSITPVPNQNAIIVEGSPEDYAVIQQILSLLESSKPVAKPKIFKLKNARAADIAEVIGRVFQSRALPKGYPPTTLTPDVSTNSLIVSASPDLLDEIGQIITQLDSQPIVPPMEPHVFPLKNARAITIVPQIESMLKQMMQAQGVTKSPYTVVANDRTNTIIVTAPPTYVEQIQKVIDILDAVPSYATVELDIVRLKRADANELGKVLDGMLASSAKRGEATEMLTRLQVSLERAGEKGTLDLDKPIRYVPDKGTQSIVLMSTAENIRILRGIVSILDAVPLVPDLRARVYPLKTADVTEVQRTLNDIFNKSDRLTKMPGTTHNVGVPENTTGQALALPVALGADKASNTLIAAGSEESLALIEVLVGQLDQPQPNILYPIRTIGMKNANASKLAKVIQDIMDARAARAKAIGANWAGQKGQAIIRVDDRINVLLVSASPEDFTMIQTLVKQLDAAPLPTTPPTLIALEHIDAETTAKMLDEFFKARNKIQPLPTEIQPAFPATMPIIIPDPRSNALIVSAGKKALTEIQDLVTQLDTMKITKKMEIAVIPLRSADASQLAQAITQVLNPAKDQAGLKQAVILEFIRQTPEGKCLTQQALKDQTFVYGEKETNLLIAVAPSDTICLIKALAESIDRVAPSVEIRVFALTNADATQTKKIIEELFAVGKSTSGTQGPGASAVTVGGPGGAAGPVGPAGTTGGPVSRLEKATLAVTADPRTNSLLVTGTAAYLDMVKKIVDSLDDKEATEQKTEVIALKNADADTVQKTVSTLIENRLKMLQSVYGEEGLAPERLLERQVNIVADNTSRKLILEASPRYFGIVRKIIEELDAAPSQVMIQCMIVQVSLNGRIEYGFEAVGQDLSFTKAQTAPGIGPGHDIVVGSDVGAAGSGGPAGFVFSLNGEDFSMLLRALNTDGKLNVVSRPQILARDNAEAKISIGQRVPFPSGATVAPETGFVTPTIDYEDVGTILTVVPHINPEGFVNLEVKPEISSISPSSVPITAGLNAPIFNKNTVETYVTIKDGETVVIGGLITRSVNHTEVKVPFLGDIPLLGLAFKSLVDSEDRSELLVILTPKLMDTVDKARRISEEERDMMVMLPKEIRESQLMGRLRQTFDEEGFPCTQPADEVEDGIKPFVKQPPCFDQLLRGFKRTCDQ